jgi:hypothetical protein
MNNLLEEIFPFPPASFLHVAVDVEPYKGFVKSPYKKPFLLPNTDVLLDEESFAKVSLSYSSEGLFLSVLVEKAFENVTFPSVEQGDSFECFLDTRDLKTAGSIHKFCHHFVFFPKEIGDKKGCELTKFRGDDAHPLCDSSLLNVETTFKKQSYEMLICIDREALYGFDPHSFNRLGFTYRINRVGGEPQHFNLSSRDYAIEKYPSLWASLKLKPQTN